MSDIGISRQPWEKCDTASSPVARGEFCKDRQALA